jgi:pimeloyl-ACP methyl ester carboxylesterase
MAGGHTLRVTATDPRVRCALALVPFTGADTVEPDPRLIEAIMADVAAHGRGEPPGMIPSIGRPGELAVMNTDGAWEWSSRMTVDAPNFRNEITLASLVEVASYRPADIAEQIRVPLRIILAADDAITPAAAARSALAAVSGLDVVEFPGTHFELFEEHLGAVVDATVSWFRRHL